VGGEGDRVQRYTRALVPASSGRTPIICPLLDQRQEYVTFGGNLHNHRGRGCRLFDGTTGGWLARAGYVFSPASDDNGNSPDSPTLEQWRGARLFLNDLAAIAGPFALTVVGLSPRSTHWASLDTLRLWLRSRAGRERLSTYTLRVFAPADYLSQWRQWFAQRLGFATIPGGEEPPPSPPRTAMDSPEAVQEWLTRHGLVYAELATAMGRPLQQVKNVLAGRVRWASDFQDAVQRVVAQFAPPSPPTA
jgi:hypothetical protein